MKWFTIQSGTLSQRVKPPFSWTGGKVKLAPKLTQRFPNHINRYIEPFLGSGSVLIELLNDRYVPEVIASDLNCDVITFYNTVTYNLESLIQTLQDIQIFNNSEEHFYFIRDEFIPENNLEKASRFFYLMNYCYAGLYRVNASGRFNAPYGKTRARSVERVKRSVGMLSGLNRLFNHGTGSIEFKCKGFEYLFDMRFNVGDFVYLDPPYIPLTDTANFTEYTTDGFGLDEHERLNELMELIDSHGAKFMMSNSDTSETRRIYGSWNIHTIPVLRIINPDDMKYIDEVIITNYEIGE